jgi:hypothetical protein
MKVVVYGQTLMKLCQDLAEIESKIYDLFGVAPALIIVNTDGKDVKDVIIAAAKRIEEIRQNLKTISISAKHGTD